MARRFLVLHGWQNHRPRQHWQWQLVEALRREGEQVLHPQLPDPDRPSLDAWTGTLRAEPAQLGDGERVVLAHSLAVVLWLHAARLLSGPERVDRVLLVSPPSPAVLAGHEEVASTPATGPGPRSRRGATTRPPGSAPAEQAGQRIQALYERREPVPGRRSHGHGCRATTSSVLL